jgi:ABC-type glycerol-3-phosphate transport system substrate-binding protein
MKIAKAEKAAGKDGYIVRGGSPDNIVSDFIPILLANGGWVVDDNNKPTVNTDQMKAAVKQYQELFSYGDTMDKDDIVAAIDGGKAALAVGWPGWYQPKEGSAGGYTTIPSQLTSGSAELNTSMYGVWTVGITNNSQHKDLALKLLQYIMDPKTQLASIENGGVPCRKSCLMDKDVLAKHPQYEIVYNALQKGTYRPVIEQWNDFTTILGTEIDNILKGTKDIDTGLKDAQDQLDTLMS